MLHLAMILLIWPATADHRFKTAGTSRPTVLLVRVDRPGLAPAPAAIPPPPPAQTPDSGKAEETPRQPTRKARFLVAPDLSALEEIPVSFSGSLDIRLHVTQLGTVDHVTVLRSDPLPKELREGLLLRFSQARLAPATIGTEPVPSTLDVVIGYEAAPRPLREDP